MKLKVLARTIPLLACLLLANGCVTKALWQNSNLEGWNEPADNPNVRLFQSKPPGNLLVVYDEYHERSGITVTRAYWLNENEPLIQKRLAPRFVSTNSVFCLTAVPVFLLAPDGANLPPAYAVVETNRQSFTLYADAVKTSSHDLPFYNDGKGKVEKAFFTPPAVTADLTIVGAILGYWYLASQASGYNEPY